MFGIPRSPRTVGVAVAFAAALVVAPSGARAQGLTQSSGGEVVQQSASLQTRDLAQQLGAKLSVQAPDELNIGATLNGTLLEPEKLERLGLVGLHKGARVTAFRSAPQKLHVEVDELEPVPLTRKATLRVDAGGRLIAP